MKSTIILRLFPLLLTVALLGIIGESAADQFSSVPREDFWLPGPGMINAVAQANGVTYVGGSFQSVLTSQPSGVGAYDLNSGARDPDFPLVNGRALAVLPDNEGGWFIGGGFAGVGSIALQNLAHVRADKTVDSSWTPNPDGYVFTLALSANVLYVGGGFSTIGSQRRGGIAAIDVTNGQVTGWNPNRTPDEFPQVNCVAVSGQTVYVGGGFSSMGGQPRRNLAALDATTGNATDWNPNPNLAATSGWIQGIRKIVVSANSIYVVGGFTEMAGQVRQHVAAFDEAGGQLRSWDPNPSSDPDPNSEPVDVSGLAVCCDKVNVSGRFDMIGGQARHDLAALDAVTGQATSRDPSTASGYSVYKASYIDSSALALDGNVLYVAGSISATPFWVIELLALDATAGEFKSWRVTPSGPVTSLAVQGSTLLAGENWRGLASPQAETRTRPLLAALDVATGQPLDWGPAHRPGQIGGGSVDGLAVTSDAVCFVGTIAIGDPDIRTVRMVGGVGASDLENGALLPWCLGPAQAPEAVPSESPVVFGAIASDATSIYVSGRHSGPGNNPDSIFSLSAHPDKEILAMTAFGNVHYLAGEFSRIAGQTRSHLAAVDLATGQLTDWNSGANKAAGMERFALSASELALAVVGDFASIGGKQRSRFAVFPRSESPQILSQPESQRVLVGQMARLSVQAIGPEPKQYQWSRNGTDLPGATQATFVVSDAQLSDSGEYSARISSSAGAVQTRRATLTVLDPAGWARCLRHTRQRFRHPVGRLLRRCAG